MSLHVPSNYNPIPVFPGKRVVWGQRKDCWIYLTRTPKLYHRAKQTTWKNQTLFLSIMGQETTAKLCLSTYRFQNKMFVNYSGDVIQGNKISLCISVVWGRLSFMLFFSNISRVIFSPFHFRLHLSRSTLCMLCCLVLSVLHLPSCYLLQHHQMQ